MIPAEQKGERPVQRNNYEQMRDKMRGAFLQYDQQKMIDKFHLDHDADYLYLPFVSRNYRIDRRTGVVTWSDDGFVHTVEADYNESMTLYDVLCNSKDDCRLAGKFCPLHAAKGCASTVRVGSDLFQPAAKQFQGRMELLKKALRALGKPSPLGGDAAAEVWVLPFLPVVIQFWDADEEFPASFTMLYDENILDYMHFETVFFMTAHLLARVQEAAVKADG